MTLIWNWYMIDVRLKWQKVSVASDSWDVWALKIHLQRLALRKKKKKKQLRRQPTTGVSVCACVCASVREKERCTLSLYWNMRFGAGVGVKVPRREKVASWTRHERLSVSVGPQPSSGNCPSRRGLPPSGAWPRPWGHWTTAPWMRWEGGEEVGDPEWWRRRRRGETLMLVDWSFIYIKVCQKKKSH